MFILWNVSTLADMLYAEKLTAISQELYAREPSAYNRILPDEYENSGFQDARTV
jgi:hypothetical protein